MPNTRRTAGILGPAPDLRGLLFGPIAAVLLAAAIICLPYGVPGYNPVRQTVSEIGEVGSPMRLAFTSMLVAVAGCHLVFALGLQNFARERDLSTVPAWLVGAMMITVAGVGYFSYPHPLHNLFGLSELVGYQAPLALALSWRRKPGLRGLIVFSSVMAVLQESALVANLSVLDLHSGLWLLERPVYGLIQRTLFAAWCVWCFGTGLWLWRWRASGARP